MELHPEQPVTPDDREPLAAVIHRAERHVPCRLRGVAVDEVEVVAVGDVADPRMVTRLPHRVPADLRDARHAGELHDRAAEETEARLASVLLAAVEQQLHPHADPEERHAALARAAQPGYEAVAVELARAVAEVPDPR